MASTIFSMEKQDLRVKNMDPATLAIISTATAIVSGTFSALTSISQGKAKQRLADRNAQISEQQAQQAEQEAAFEETVQRSKTQRLRSAQRAALGASGGEVDTGSALLVLEKTATVGEMDALTIRYRGDVAAQRARAQAGSERFEGQVARQAGTVGAGKSVLTGLTRASEAAKPLIKE